MDQSCSGQSTAKLVVVNGFEGEAIELSVEQLEPRIMPESTAGFLE